MDAKSVEVRDRAVQRATRLNRVTLGYNSIEALLALGAGAHAGSVSLVGFGLDSIVEVSAALVMAWRLRAEGGGRCTQAADRRATRAVAMSFALIAVVVVREAFEQFRSGDGPAPTAAGITLTAISLLVMPWLAHAKRRLAPALGSRAQEAEARQTSLCAWMSGTVLVGLSANAALGWWWADSAAGVGVAGFAAVEAIRTWRAESLEDTCCA